jgi:L-ribulose-5-phosphate 3-epimerase
MKMQPLNQNIRSIRYAINDWTFRSYWSYEQFIHGAQAAGMDAVELNVDDNPASYLSLSANAGTAKRRAEAAEQGGLCICSLSTVLFQQYPLNSFDPFIRFKAAEMAKKMLELAAASGAKVILVIPGAVTPELRYDRAYTLAQESLHTLGVEAQAMGIKIGLENVSNNKFLWSPLELAGFIDELGQASIGAYLDIGNVMTMGYPEHWIAILGARIMAIQAKDMKESMILSQGAVPFNMGDVNWVKVAQAVDEIGFKGYITATPPEVAADMNQFLLSCTLDLKAYFK